MKYITRKELAERWDCHPTNLDYHVRMKRLRTKKVMNKTQYNMDDVFQFETERQKRIKVPVEKTVEVSTWKRIVNQLKSCFL